MEEADAENDGDDAFGAPMFNYVHHRTDLSVPKVKEEVG